MLVEVHQAETLPPSQASLAAELAHRGFAHVAEAYQEARKRDASFQLSQRELEGLGYGLLERGRALDVIEVMKLWTALFPEDWDTADSLAVAYQTAGNTPLTFSIAGSRWNLTPETPTPPSISKCSRRVRPEGPSVRERRELSVAGSRPA